MTDSSHRLRFGVYPPGFNQIKLINKLDRELNLVRRGGREHQAFGDWPWLPIAASLLNPNLVHFPQEERGRVFNKKAQEEKRYHWHHLRDMACVLGLACRHDFHGGGLFQRGHTVLSPTAHPTSSGNTSPILVLNTHSGPVWDMATLWHGCNYVGQGLCSWQRKHSSYSTWVILNESLYLVINFIIIQPLPLTPKFISQSKLAEIH